MSVKESGQNRTGISFGQDIIYTIRVEDVGSGVDSSEIYYGIAKKESADRVTNWQRPVKSLTLNKDGTYSFRVEVKGRGYLFVKVTDRVENTTCSNSIRALVLEDSEAGIQAAHSACIPVLCVPDLHHPAPAYESMTAAILSSLHEVPGWLETQNAQ